MFSGVKFASGPALAGILAGALSCASLSLDPAVRAEADLRSRLKRHMDYLLGADTRHYSVSLNDDESGFRFEIDAGRKYPSASTMKIAVMTAVYQLAQTGELSLSDRIMIHNRFLSVVDGSEYSVPPETLRSCPYRTYKKIGERMSLRDLCADMIQSSSNLATNLLIQHVGVDRIQETLEGLGIRGTRIIRGLYDELAFDRDWHNQLTARSVEATLEVLARPGMFRRELREEMLAVMANTCESHRERIPAYLPLGVIVAQKGGTTEDVLHDAGIVYPRRASPFTLVILTEGYTSRGRVDDRMAFASRYIFDELMVFRRQQAAFRAAQRNAPKPRGIK